MSIHKNWTETEIRTAVNLRQAGKTWDYIAEILGRTTESVRLKLRRTPKKINFVSQPGGGYLPADYVEALKKMNEPFPPNMGQTVRAVGGLTANEIAAMGDAIDAQQALKEEPPKTFEADKERAGNDYWRREYKALESKYEKALRANAATEQLVAMASELAPKSYNPAPEIKYPNRKGGNNGKPQSAVLILSDTHVGQVIEASQTMGFGRYDFPTFLARLKYLEESISSIMQDHTTTRIDELIVCLGGDMLHGNLNHGAEAGQKNALFNQLYSGGHALAQFLRNVATLAPVVRVYCTVGNHTRWGTQHKMPTENRYSNFDQVLYAYIQALTKDISSVHWNLDTQPFALFDVQGFKFHLSHGDHLRGGDKALGIPNHSVGRMVSSTAQLFGKHGLPSPHYFLLGHLHRSIALPHARGSVVVNGGFAGMDGYGLAGGFSPVDPSQTFFLVHPKFGKTSTYDIWLRNAVQNDDIPPYDIPLEFPCL